MTEETDRRLENLLGGPALARLRLRLRRHFERLDPDSAEAPLRLAALLAEEREALALLAGRPPSLARSMQVDIAVLDAALRDAGIAPSLRAALERLDGPIESRAAAQAEKLAGWSAAIGSCAHPELARFLGSAAGPKLLKRLSRHDANLATQLLRRAEAVLRRLPAGGLPRAQLAAEALGNSHALDSGQATATLVLAVWRHPCGEAPEAEERAEEPGEDGGRAEERARDTWARAGVAVNELAKPALVLNLPVRAGERPAGAAGEPAFLSLRQLLRTPPRWAVAGLEVFVCENPNLVAIAADALGPSCRALVCTDGAPAAAQRTLLTQLSQAGARLYYHGDFDWPGLRLANHALRTFGARPWRFGAGDYEAACSAAPGKEPDLAGAPVAAAWDAELAPAMERRGFAVAEEAVAETLLRDLHPSSASGDAPPG